jgi:hypothetical protein
MGLFCEFLEERRTAGIGGLGDEEEEIRDWRLR